MKQRIFLGAAAFVVLGGCADMGGLFQPRDRARPAAQPTEPLDTVAPAPVAPPANATSEEEFDTTSVEEREAAAEKPASGETALGTTVASLGDPAKSGFWLETPLVSAPAKGRVEYPANGKSAQVDLIPIEGEATAGSRISLPAMRLVEAPLTDLVELRVFRN